MKGRNDMSICEAGLKEMVQHYFDTVLFRGGQSPRIESVSQDAHSEVFRVKTSPKGSSEPEPEVFNLAEYRHGSK